MSSSIIFVGCVYAMCFLTTPVVSKAARSLNNYRSLQDGSADVLINSNAIPEHIREHLNNFFSELTPSKLLTILRSGQWAQETPYEFKPEPDVEAHPRGYEELYNDFLQSRKQRTYSSGV